MTNFEDGPAAGQCLMLKRSPYFLRVVVSPRGNWDALDLVGDVPAARELIHVYRRRQAPDKIGWCHVRMGGRRPNGSGFYKMVDYDHYPACPLTQEQLRDDSAWQAWATAEFKTLTTTPRIHRADEEA